MSTFNSEALSLIYIMNTNWSTTKEEYKEHIMQASLQHKGILMTKSKPINGKYSID
jgi:hypothetical protein